MNIQMPSISPPIKKMCTDSVDVPLPKIVSPASATRPTIKPMKTMNPLGPTAPIQKTTQLPEVPMAVLVGTVMLEPAGRTHKIGPAPTLEQKLGDGGLLGQEVPMMQNLGPGQVKVVVPLEFWTHWGLL